VDRDVLNVDRKDGPISRLRFHVAGNDVNFVSIRIIYQNGYTEDLSLNQLVKAGTYSDLDLPGDRNYLRQIQMVYRSRADFDGKSTVRVYASHPRGGPGQPRR